jgi:predicted aldo/keto reductase-like oxidoreductase
MPTLGFGAMELRGAQRGPDITDAEAQQIVGRVLDSGINFIDTSIDYGLIEERHAPSAPAAALAPDRCESTSLCVPGAHTG